MKLYHKREILGGGDLFKGEKGETGPPGPPGPKGQDGQDGKGLMRFRLQRNLETQYRAPMATLYDRTKRWTSRSGHIK